MPSEAPNANTPSRTAKPPRRWLRRLLVLLVLTAVGAWFAPTVVAKSALRNRFARSALADLRGNVTVGGASLGWLSPVELWDVVVTDAQGRTLLTAAKITSSKTLLALARDRSNLGEFVVERPVADVVCEKGTTNLEDAIANYLKDEPTAPTRPAVSVRVTDGRLTLRDADTSRDAEFTLPTITAVIPADRAEPVAVKVSAAAASSGTLGADLSIGTASTAKVAAAGFPLESLAPVVKRLDPRATLGGKLTADLSVGWSRDDAGRPAVRVEGTASARDLDFAGPWLNGDHLKLAAADLPLKLETAGRAVRVERAELTCDAGRVAASGTFDPDGALDTWVDTAGLTVAADVDLARLVALLPKTFRVRAGTAVREGNLAAKLASRATPAGTTWDGEVRAAGLKAERDGKTLEWAEPLSVEFSGRVPPGHLPTFDKFLCRSDFVAVTAKGDPESFQAAANIYLDRLFNHLGEFIDLKGVKVGGEASVWLTATRSAAGAFQAEAGADLKDFAYADGHRTLAEKRASLKVSAAGSWQKRGPIRLETGTVTLTASAGKFGNDTFEAKLVEPLPDARRPAGGKLLASLGGDLGRWTGRAREFVSIPRHYVFGGETTATGVVRIQPTGVNVDGLSAAIKKAHFRGAGLDIDEPYLNATGDMALTLATGRLVFTPLKITSPTLNVTGGTLTIDVPPNGSASVSGEGRAESNLTGLARTLRMQPDPNAADAVHGRGAGPIRFRWQDDTTTFGGTLDLTDVAYGPRDKPTWREAAMTLDLDGRYDLTPDTFTVNRVKLDRPGLGVDARGVWAKFTTTQDVAIDGTLTYDLAVLTPEVRNAVGGGFQAAGKGKRPFSLAGSLAPAAAGGKAPQPTSTFAKLTASGGIGWDDIKAYGFDVGPGELNAKVANGVATVSPISATFGGGRVTLAPTARLDPAPGEVSFAKGTVVDRAKLTPAACAGALGYALPVIANAAQAEGEVSAVLGDNRFPLANFAGGTLKGQVVVHKASVGAGPVITEIAKLLGEPSARMTLANDMTVPVRVENGRVHHENLAVTVNGYVIKTNGSVGLDGSLAVVADVPIPGTFPGFKNNPALKKALEGKVIKVPVAGTMSQPAVDPQRFQAALADVARQGVREAGQDLLKKELEKVIPGGLPIPGQGGNAPKMPFPFPLKK